MTNTKPAVADPMSLAVAKTIERVRRGQWWWGEYDDGSFWTECLSRLTWEERGTGRKNIELRGRATDARRADLIQTRDYVVRTLTAAQARRCGLVDQVEKALAADRDQEG